MANLDLIPNSLVGKKLGGVTYEKRFGWSSPLESITKTWAAIWENDQNFDLRYTWNFIVYGPTSQQGANSELEIFPAVKE